MEYWTTFKMRLWWSERKASRSFPKKKSKHTSWIFLTSGKKVKRGDACWGPAGRSSPLSQPSVLLQQVKRSNINSVFWTGCELSVNECERRVNVCGDTEHLQKCFAVPQCGCLTPDPWPVPHTPATVPATCWLKCHVYLKNSLRSHIIRHNSSSCKYKIGRLSWRTPSCHYFSCAGFITSFAVSIRLLTRPSLLTSLLSRQSPQMHPRQPLTTWMPQSTSCSAPIDSRMENSTTCHITAFLGNSHVSHSVWFTR